MSTYSFNITNLSQFSNGDSCHVVGTVGIMTSGVVRARANIDETFIWSNNNQITASGTWSGQGTASYTITLTSSQLIFDYTYTWGSAGGWQDVQLQVYKAMSPWVQVKYPYKKVNGQWVLQTDVSTVFDSTKGYIRGDNPTEQ